MKDRNGPIFKNGVLLIGADSIYRMDDSNWALSEVISFDKFETPQQEVEESKEAVQSNAAEDDGFKFVESAFEIQSSDSILLVFSDGSAWSVFENISCEMIARKASKDKHKNLIGGQLIQLE